MQTSRSILSTQTTLLDIVGEPNVMSYKTLRQPCQQHALFRHGPGRIAQESPPITIIIETDWSSDRETQTRVSVHSRVTCDTVGVCRVQSLLCPSSKPASLIVTVQATGQCSDPRELTRYMTVCIQMHAELVVLVG